MKLGENLRKLRRSADLTQEELAAYLGVTSQAVSKWERGDGYPGITLLPAIAARFDITVDALLGTDRQPDRGRLAEINGRAGRLVCEGRFDEGVALIRETIADNPTEYKQRLQLALMYRNMAATADGNEMRLSYLREAAAIYEYVLEYCCGRRDTGTQWEAERYLYEIYYALGERENLNKLKSTASVSLFANDIDLRTPDFAKGNDLVLAVQTAVMKLAANLLLMTLKLAEREYEPGENITHEALPGEGEWPNTPEERIRILEMGCDLFDLVFGDDYAGFYLLPAHSGAAQAARLALSLGDNERAVKALRRSADYVVRHDPGGAVNNAAGHLLEAIMNIPKAEPAANPHARALERIDPETRELLLKPVSSSLLLNRLNAVGIGTGFNYPNVPSSSAAVLASLSDAVYDPLRTDARFAEIEELLARHAGTKPDPETDGIYKSVLKW